MAVRTTIPTFKTGNKKEGLNNDILITKKKVLPKFSNPRIKPEMMVLPENLVLPRKI